MTKNVQIQTFFRNTTTPYTQSEEISLYENLIIHYIKTKCFDLAVDHLYLLSHLEKPTTSSTKLRSYKNYSIRLFTLVEHAVAHNTTPTASLLELTLSCIRAIEETENMEDYQQVEATCIKRIGLYFTSHQENIFLTTIQKATLYINENIFSPLNLESVSDYLNVSPNYLSHLFKKDLQMNFIDYINFQRIEIATYYIRYTDEGLSQITEQLNFCNQSYFTATFKKYMGMTPNQFRKIHSRKHETLSLSMNK